MAASERPTYGNWIKPRSAGLYGLSWFSTVILLVGLILVIILFFFSWVLAVGALLLLFGVLAPLRYRDRWGRTVLERAAEALQWQIRRRGRTYRAGPLSSTPVATFQLPGLAASITAHEGIDGHRRPFVLLEHRTTRHVATVIECMPAGDVLVDPLQVDTWVGGWGQWLASVSHEAEIVAASVTVESAPDSGVRLNREISTRLAEDAPPFAQQVLGEIADTFGSGSASTRCFVTLTWAMPRRRHGLETIVVEIAARLPELTKALDLAGGGAARPLNRAEVAAVLRGAFDPQIAGDLEAAGANQLDWDDCGPQATEEHQSFYVHDGALSVSWVMGEAPRGAVRSHMLGRLLAPNREVDRKRVTMLYRLYDPAKAAEIVEQDIDTSNYLATSQRRTKARQAIGVRAAHKAAEEEALGAGLVRFGAVVTATLAVDPEDIDEETLARTRSVVENLGAQARIQLRLARRAQASTFVAGLPLGLVLPEHVSGARAWMD